MCTCAHTLRFSVCTSCILAMDFNTVITVTAAHMKFPLHSLIPFLLSLLNILRLLSQETPSILSLLAWDPYYIVLGGDNRNNVSIVIAQQYLHYCLPTPCHRNLFMSNCLAMNVCSGSAILALWHHVTIYCDVFMGVTTPEESNTIRAANF
jgi:hypothetical protein